MSASPSPFADVPLAPADPILGLTEAYNADPRPEKVNLGVGVYQDESGKVPVLNVVREAEERWHDREETKSYLSQVGPPSYITEVQKLLLGPDSLLLNDGRVVTVQAPGGTGALRVGADFLKKYYPESTVWVSSPTWENHCALFEAAGFRTESYPYYNPETHDLDFEGMKRTIRGLPSQSIVLLHVCCHNPSGVDLSRDQWREMVEIFRTSDLIPFIDFAYQGFGEGIEPDAFAVRAFAEAEIPCLISSSFSKSFSLYRERVGALSFITTSREEAERVLSQVKRTIRTNYSNPPSHGAQVVALVLSDPALRARWEEELAGMRNRIQEMRHLFVETLREKGVKRDFSFIERQKGMFSFAGLPLEDVRQLRDRYGLYMTDSSRMCVAAMNERNIGYICDALAEVVGT
ncbi:MAG: aspartate/tyrosine/aromatic aminotransferase [Armatimonadetes bacterium]|nr:aspartate/tyrosine/aromatic aminotransferase [Armatimonadota bacterium]